MIQFSAKSAVCVAAAFGVAVSAVLPASAATLTNRDTKAYNVLVIEGENERHVTIEPDQSVENICATTCSIALTDDSEMVDIALADQLMIEEGQIYLLDEQSSEASPGGEASGQDGPEADPPEPGAPGNQQ